MLWSSSLAWRGEEFKWSSQRSFPWSFWGVLQSVCTGLLSSRAPVIASAVGLRHGPSHTHIHTQFLGWASECYSYGEIWPSHAYKPVPTKYSPSIIVLLSLLHNYAKGFYCVTQKSSGTYWSERNCTAHTIHKLAVIITRGKTDVVASVNDLMPTVKGWYLTKKKCHWKSCFYRLN